MRTFAWIVAVTVIGVTPAAADQVLWEASAWNPSRTRIHTTRLVKRDDGRIETERVLGGVVDGIGMIAIPLHVGPTGGWRVDYVRSRSSRSGAPLYWNRSCVYVTPDADGTTDLAGDLEFQIIRQVLAHWEQRTRSCSYLRLIADDPIGSEVGYDGRNVIKFRHDVWGRPAIGDDPPEMYDPSAAAITFLYYIDRPGKPDDGIIRDADIEMNAVHFRIASCTGPGQCTTNGDAGTISDFANTLTHEIGHLIGLDHTCWDMGGPAPEDHEGNTIPDCFPVASLPPDVTDATMYNYQDPGEVKKATVEDDDVAGFCGIYPLGSDPDDCRRAFDDDDDGWCAIAPPPARHAPRPPWAAVLLVLGACALALRPLSRPRPRSRRR